MGLEFVVSRGLLGALLGRGRGVLEDLQVVGGFLVVAFQLAAFEDGALRVELTVEEAVGCSLILCHGSVLPYAITRPLSMYWPAS